MAASSAAASPNPSAPAVTLDPAAAPATASTGPDAVLVTVSNPLQVARERETLSVDASSVERSFPYFDLDKVVVVDASGAPVLSQLLDVDGVDGAEQLVFQTDLGPGETKTFKLRQGARELATHEQYKVYGRFVRERHDDFAWENDRIAHRMYGPDLETFVKEPLTSSGIDAWSKRVERLVINEWYQTDAYHDDHGEGADYYSVGKSRGCGGLGAWSNGKFFGSKNFTTSRVLANGPIRLVFELDYAAWSTGGARVTETKRVTLDAGSAFNHFESRFKGGAFVASMGIAKHAGSTLQADPAGSWLRTWEPLKGGEGGNLGCAIVLAEGQGKAEQLDSDYLLTAPVPANGVLRYYAGFAWDRAGRVPDEPSWAKAVEAQQARLKSPVQIKVEVLPTARTWALLGADLLATNGAQVEPSGAVRINGTALVALARVAAASKDPNYVEYLKHIATAAIQADGTVLGVANPDLSAFDTGRALLTLRRTVPGTTDEQRTMPALSGLRARLTALPRSKDGLVLHGPSAVSQVWLDDTTTLLPFMAEYATVFGEAALFDDIARQVATVERKLRDGRTGLLVPAVDEAKQQKWANPSTGAAAVIWSQAVGAYAAALVDVLELMPANHPQRAALNASLGRLVASVTKAQDAGGLWWQVTDVGKRDKNYLESSGSSFFVYAIAKGSRIGSLDVAKQRTVIDRGFRAAVDALADVDKQGHLQLKQGSSTPDLNAVTSPDTLLTTFTAPGQTNEPTAVAAFTLAATEVLALPR